MFFVVVFMFSLITTTVQVSWPEGTYTLLKPKTGCPKGWKEGWRFQDNENRHNFNFISRWHQFAGTFGKDMKFYYCTKDFRTSSERDWPRGSYCILRHGPSCPRHFSSGTVYWDDEDTANQNRHGGTLPSGTFNENTQIHYCCRKDGSTSTRIRLPIRKPFFLLMAGSRCQQVKGMKVWEVKVTTDDEDDYNTNFAEGVHPRKSGSTNNTLYYCYYKKH